MTQINSLDKGKRFFGRNDEAHPFCRAYVPDMESQGHPPRERAQCVNAPAKIVCSITCDNETEADLRGPPRGVNRGFLLFTSTYLASKVRANLIGRFVQADGLVQP